MAQRSLFLLLDIDNTLYEYAETGFGAQIHDLIFEYAEKKLNLSNAEAASLSQKYYENYGLSLHGYVFHHGVDPKDYSNYVHNCSYERLSYNAPLVDMLTRLHYGTAAASEPKNKEEGEEQASAHVHGQQEGVLHHLYFFTNANRPHARNVLTPLGLKPLFTRPRQPGSPATDAHRQCDEAGFEDAVEWLGFSYEDQWRLTGELKANKPMKPAYEAIFRAIDAEIALDEAEQRGEAFPPGAAKGTAADERANGSSLSSPTAAFTAHKRAHLQPRNMVMVDDTLMNLNAPLELGWNVVWYAHGDQQLPKDGEKAHLYEAAVAAGRMKIIRQLLDLEQAVEELAAIP